MENQEEKTEEKFQETWAVLEVMGKGRYGGRVREQKVFGVPMIRIDIPTGKPGEFSMSKFFHPQALFCVTPVGEAEATAVALYDTAPPVHMWEMAARKQITAGSEDDSSDFE